MKVSKLIDFVKHIVHIGVVDTAEQELNLIFVIGLFVVILAIFVDKIENIPKLSESKGETNMP